MSEKKKNKLAILVTVALVMIIGVLGLLKNPGTLDGDQLLLV